MLKKCRFIYVPVIYFLVLIISGFVLGFIAHEVLSPINAYAEKRIIYQCPMHPSVQQDSPGNCPICGMHLEKKEIKTQAQPAARQHDPGAAVPGYVPVNVPLEKQKLMGLAVSRVQRMPLERTITTVGRVSFDETRMYHVHTKSDGFIEEIYVDYVGQKVEKGQPLYSIYSSELLSIQSEYLVAFNSKPRDASAVEGAKRKLGLFDIGPAEIAEIEKTGHPLKALKIRSPAKGFVIAKKALQGMKVSTEDALYDIADLSNVWVLGDLYENDLPFVKVGQEAEISFPFAAEKTWKGKISFMYPTIDEKTRTLPVRIELANPDYELKPEMTASIKIRGDLGEHLAVPESAIMYTGERSIVFVKGSAESFSPLDVKVGVKANGYYEILEGLDEGREVVTQANFLIDSESRLQASRQGNGVSASNGEQHHH